MQSAVFSSFFTMPVRYSSFSLENIHTFAPARAADSCAVRNWAAPELLKSLGAHGHGGQGRFWPFIKWTNITKQYLDFTMTLTSCKTWELAPFNFVSVGIIAAAFAAFLNLWSPKCFPGADLLDASHADCSMDELALESLLRKSLSHPAEPRICGFCSKSHFLLKEIVLS